MALSISTLQIPIGEVNMYSKGFRNLIENHIALLQVDPSTTQISLNPHDEDKYIGDFYELLQHLEVTQDMFWITMRVNGLHSPLDYQGDLSQILVPSLTTIQNLLTRYINKVSIG